ncbi:hypothetical protein F2P81_015920 [Scophthalmus maximus]|uniref:3'-5' exonuclease domain-containing protein n=1 Tax=Scophthalmus maximus TaxID=52904 RepID=A0A6A4SFL7_SCOMX|nr:hypothetical protein F2P81_015920 [Scophthalmus maximus]
MEQSQINIVVCRVICTKIVFTWQGLDPAVLRDQLFELWNRKELQTLTLSSLSEQQALELQHRALRLLTDTQASFVESLINIYHLGSLDPALLRLHIVKLQALKCYKEAAVLCVKLKLQKEVNMEEMCVPLILQDKMSLAESFVAGHKDLEQRLVTLLDSWCHPYFNVEQISVRFPRLSLSKHSMGQIQPKLLAKHILRLVEKFNIDHGLYPNALHKRRLDSLRFLMYKRFVEVSNAARSHISLIIIIYTNDHELQIKLVEMLLQYCSIQKAAQWSLRYNIPRNRLPIGVWETQQSLPPDLHDSAQAEEWIPSQPHCQRFYQVPLTKDKVHFVDTVEALQRCRHIVLKDGGVVGVDMEWQPSFGCILTQRVALIQLAVYDQVFLLDLCENGFCQHPDTVSFIRSLFSKRNVLKLGYGMTGDLKCLLATWHQFLEEPLKMEGVLDLLRIHQKIQSGKVNRTHNGPKDVLVGEDSAEKGLSLMIRQVLGRPLDKTEQMSNWEKRPLRISQIRYAVADAYCLLDVYSILSSNPAHFGLPADLSSVSSSQSGKSGDKMRKGKQAKEKKWNLGKEECQGAQRVSPPRSDTEKGLLCGEKPSEKNPPLPPQQLRVVCDNMLQGLGRYLRCLGVDVVMLENTDDHREAGRHKRKAVSYSHVDNRSKVPDQQQQQPPLSIFTACNSDQYAAVPREDMVRMLKRKGFLQDQDNAEHAQQTSRQQEEEKLGDILTPCLTPQLPRYALHCRWAPLSGLDPDTLTFPGGAPMQLQAVPPALLPRIPHFYVCTRCGKVFWEGSHFGRVLSMFEEVLHITDKDTDFAEVPVTAAQQN